MNAPERRAEENQLRRICDLRRDRRPLDVLRPLLAQPFFLALHVGPFERGEMHRHHVRATAPCSEALQRLIGQSIPLARHDQHDRRLAGTKLELILVAQRLVDAVVIALDRLKQQDDAGNGDDRDPAALREFGDDNDHERRHRCRGAGGVDRELNQNPPAFAAVARAAQFAPPARHHAGLRHGEGQERADGVERDQPVGNAVEGGQQKSPAATAR